MEEGGWGPELERALARLAKGSATGPRAIPPEPWQALDAENLRGLLRALSPPAFPGELLRADVVSICKALNQALLESYRPISLLRSLPTLYTAMLLGRGGGGAADAGHLIWIPRRTEHSPADLPRSAAVEHG